MKKAILSFISMAMLACSANASTKYEQHDVRMDQHTDDSFALQASQMSTPWMQFNLYADENLTPFNTTGLTPRFSYSINPATPGHYPTNLFTASNVFMTNNAVYVQFAGNDLAYSCANGYAVLSLYSGSERWSFARGKITIFPAPEWTGTNGAVPRTPLTWTPFLYYDTEDHGPYSFDSTNGWTGYTDAGGRYHPAITSALAVAESDPIWTAASTGYVTLASYQSATQWLSTNALDGSRLGAGSVQSNALASNVWAAILAGSSSSDHPGSNMVRNVRGGTNYLDVRVTDASVMTNFPASELAQTIFDNYHLDLANGQWWDVSFTPAVALTPPLRQLNGTWSADGFTLGGVTRTNWPTGGGSTSGVQTVSQNGVTNSPDGNGNVALGAVLTNANAFDTNGAAAAAVNVYSNAVSGAIALANGAVQRAGDNMQGNLNIGPHDLGFGGPTQALIRLYYDGTGLAVNNRIYATDYYLYDGSGSYHGNGNGLTNFPFAGLDSSTQARLVQTNDARYLAALTNPAAFDAAGAATAVSNALAAGAAGGANWTATSGTVLRTGSPLPVGSLTTDAIPAGVTCYVMDGSTSNRHFASILPGTSVTITTNTTTQPYAYTINSTATGGGGAQSPWTNTVDMASNRLLFATSDTNSYIQGLVGSGLVTNVLIRINGTNYVFGI